MKFIFFIAIFFTSNCLAQLKWDELSFTQQKLLLPFEPEWNSMTIESRRKLIANTNKWLAMTPQERKLSQQKLTKFKQLPIEQQQKIKTRIEQFKNLSPEQQRQLKNAYKRYQQLNPEQRRKMRRKFGQLTPLQKSEKIESFKRMEQKAEFINEFASKNRRPIVAVFRGLKKSDRIKLRKHMLRLSALQRHQLTLNLLDMGMEQRIKFIESI